MKRPCKDCPIHPTSEFGMMANDLGCLPSYGDAVKWKQDTGKIWACHCKQDSPCKGFTDVMDHYKEPYDLSNELITENTTIDEIYDRKLDSKV